MKFDNRSRKGFLIYVVCIMMLVCIPSIDGGLVVNQDNEVLADSPGSVKPGFIFGPYNYSTWDGDLLCLIAEWGMSPARELNFLVPFRRGHLHKYEQIRLAQFNNVIFIKNFVIGFCKIYIPESDVSMHIFSQDDSENEVIWEVDDITGDKVWEININVELYLESGGRHHGYMYGPLRNEYLDIGDRIRIKLGDEDDGYYIVRLVETISRDILFESPLIKY